MDDDDDDDGGGGGGGGGGGDDDDDDDDDDDNNNNNNKTQRGPFTHSQSHQAQNMQEHTEIKQRKAWTKEKIREVIWCYVYCKQQFTENYKSLYEIWRQRNPICRMYMDAKKLMNQKHYIMKHNKIMEMEIEEIKREMQTSQRSHPAERDEETLVHTDTIKDDEHKLNAMTTTGEETETQQNRDQITKLREKTERAYARKYGCNWTKKLVRTCTKLSSNKSRKQGDYTVE